MMPMQYNEDHCGLFSCLVISEEWINPDTDRAAFAWQWMRARFACCQLVQDFLTSIHRELTDERG